MRSELLKIFTKPISSIGLFVLMLHEWMRVARLVTPIRHTMPRWNLTSEGFRYVMRQMS